MKHKTEVRLLVTLVFVLMTSGVAAAQTGLQKAVESYIAGQAGDASEFKEKRKILQADMDGDGDRDAVVFYTLEGAGGGNSWGQQLAVFINTKGTYKAVADETVGGKFFRSYDLKSVSKGKIIGESRMCPKDTPQGLCENPKKAPANFVFKNNKLTEL